jgi:hypothetical protein
MLSNKVVNYFKNKEKNKSIQINTLKVLQVPPKDKEKELKQGYEFTNDPRLGEDLSEDHQAVINKQHKG